MPKVEMYKLNDEDLKKIAETPDKDLLSECIQGFQDIRSDMVDRGSKEYAEIRAAREEVLRRMKEGRE